MQTAVDKYVQALATKTLGCTTDLCGRLIRGKKPEDFVTLSDDPDRKLIMLMGADGLETLLHCSCGHAMLEAIGYETTYIRRKVLEGNQFKLVVCNATASPARLATWKGVAAAVAEAYPPEIAQKVYSCLPALQNLRTPASEGWSITDFESLEKLAGFDFSKIDEAGKEDHRFMTPERYLLSSGDLIATRAFLYFSCHLRELFAGNGHTYDTLGRRGMLEYICPNIEIARLGEHALIDINVSLN